MTAPQHQRRETSEGLWDKKQCSGKQTVWVSCSTNNGPFSLPGPRVSPWCCCFHCCCHWGQTGVRWPSAVRRPVSATIPGGMSPAGTRTSPRCRLPSLRSAGQGGVGEDSRRSLGWHRRICHYLAGGGSGNSLFLPEPQSSRL